MRAVSSLLCIVLLLFTGDLHVYRYESSSYCLFCLQTAHMQFVAFCIHVYVYNMKLPIRSSSNGNSKISPKLFVAFENLLDIGKKTRQLQL